MHRPKPRVLPSGPDLTPVVNIAMVILVVFMLATTFVEPQLYMQSRVALMERGGRVQLPPDWTPPTALPILVSMDPQTPGSFRADVGAQSAADSQELQALLQAQQEGFRAAGTDLENVQVEISPQSHVIWQHLITVYEAAQRAGFTNVTFTPGR